MSPIDETCRASGSAGDPHERPVHLAGAGPDAGRPSETAALGRALRGDPLADLLFQASAEPMVVLDHERRIITANPAFLQFTGQSPPQFLDRRLGEVVACVRVAHGETCGETEACGTCGANQAIRQAVAGLPRTEECRILVEGPGGPGAFDLEVRATPFAYAGASYVILAIRDIAAAKRRAVFERLFFHDILNVLGGVQGILDVWPDLDDEARTALWGEVRGQMTSLIEEVQLHRELSAAERGELTTRSETLDGAAVVSEVCALYRHHPVARERSVEAGRGNGPGEIVTDRRLLTRVLGNLVKNALEASAPGETVEVTFTGGDPSRFHVRNPGVMPESARLQVFQRSFSTKGEPGRGVGTFSAKLLVERYLKGRIGFRSEPEVGTIFEVALPLAAAESAVERGDERGDDPVEGRKAA